MSSTWGNRQRDDLYITPQDTICSFLDACAWIRRHLAESVLDPCSGEGAYFKAISERLCIRPRRYDAIDIRRGQDYLKWEAPTRYSIVISNPPYRLAQQFITKARREAEVVVFLLRLNFLGSQRRHLWWQENLPAEIYVHSKRPSFCYGSTDSCEYAHFVWIGQATTCSLRVIR